MHAFSTFRHGTLLIAMLGAAPATAVEDAATKQAKVLYTEGMKQYNLAEYVQALEAFKAGYLAKPDPTFLFNIGQCHRKVGNPELAKESYRAYLREQPDAPNRDDVERFVREADEQIEARKALGSSAAAEKLKSSLTASDRGAPVTVASSSLRRPLGIALTAAGGAVAIIGAALFGYGTVLGNGAHSAATLDERNSRDRTAMSTSIAGGVLLGLGGASAVAGAVILLLPRRETRTSWWVTPTTNGAIAGARF